MRTHASRRCAVLGAALALTLASALTRAQVTTPPPLPTVPQARPDPPPPLASPAQENTPPAAAARQAAEMARGDPVRWYQEDATEEQRLRTQRKEIGAAYEEARIACRRVVASERAQCLKDARATYEKEMATIKTAVNVR